MVSLFSYFVCSLIGWFVGWCFRQLVGLVCRTNGWAVSKVHLKNNNAGRGGEKVRLGEKFTQTDNSSTFRHLRSGVSKRDFDSLLIL